MLKKVYKVFELKNSQPYFMFYGINGSRTVELNTNLIAERKLVRDGSGKRWYKSGFHVYCSLDVLKKFIKTLKINRDTRFIVEVLAKDPKRKHERSKAYLSREIVVTKKAWNDRIPIKDF
jgi:hypothetical protein